MRGERGGGEGVGDRYDIEDMSSAIAEIVEARQLEQQRELTCAAPRSRVDLRRVREEALEEGEWKGEPGLRTLVLRLLASHRAENSRDHRGVSN